MNTARILGLSFALVTLAGAASAQQTLTSAQVRAETVAAQRAGAIPHGDLDISSASPRGDIHPAQSASAGAALTREQVKAELARARADGTLQVGETGQTFAELEPGRYPHPAQPAGLTREQVRAELALATRDGDIQVGETGHTLAEEYPQRYAAIRAHDGLTTVARN